MAVTKGVPQIIKWLIEAGADVSATDMVCLVLKIKNRKLNEEI